ncbi:unnamed protein product [Trifolium pratense]|uniref:Uncharacterized protein n=1 Tax=Trifolium pratense TaxID=57577 RepID=A0ACB0LE06_TRIPR|nr:unnamed protein product [Trifolium pratense]
MSVHIKAIQRLNLFFLKKIHRLQIPNVKLLEIVLIKSYSRTTSLLFAVVAIVLNFNLRGTLSSDSNMNFLCALMAIVNESGYQIHDNS